MSLEGSLSFWAQSPRSERVEVALSPDSEIGLRIAHHFTDLAWEYFGFK